jgi:hypothetical protein
MPTYHRPSPRRSRRSSITGAPSPYSRICGDTASGFSWSIVDLEGENEDRKDDELGIREVSFSLIWQNYKGGVYLDVYIYIYVCG